MNELELKCLEITRGFRREYYKTNRKYLIKLQKDYQARPEVRARLIEHRNRPEIKERNRIRMKQYYTRPDIKEKMKVYRNRPEVKARLREYQNRPEVREKMKEYRRRYNNKKKQVIVEDGSVSKTNETENIYGTDEETKE